MADPIFGIHGDAMRVQMQRMELIASNLANADTPNYRARDLDFEQVLSTIASSESGAQTPTPPNLGDSAVVYRTAAQPSLDGNTVEVPREQAAYADAALRYQASLNFVEGRMRTLLSAMNAE